MGRVLISTVNGQQNTDVTVVPSCPGQRASSVLLCSFGPSDARDTVPPLRRCPCHPSLPHSVQTRPKAVSQPDTTGLPFPAALAPQQCEHPCLTWPVSEGRLLAQEPFWNAPEQTAFHKTPNSIILFTRLHY